MSCRHRRASQLAATPSAATGSAGDAHRWLAGHIGDGVRLKNVLTRDFIDDSISHGLRAIGCHDDSDLDRTHQLWGVYRYTDNSIRFRNVDASPVRARSELSGSRGCASEGLSKKLHGGHSPSVSTKRSRRSFGSVAKLIRPCLHRRTRVQLDVTATTVQKLDASKLKGSLNPPDSILLIRPSPAGRPTSVSGRRG